MIRYIPTLGGYVVHRNMETEKIHSNIEPIYPGIVQSIGVLRSTYM